MLETNESRRDFLKLAGYVPPIILTMSVMPAYAQSGSGFTDRVPEDSVSELLHGNGDTKLVHGNGDTERVYGNERVHGNNGLGNGVDPAPPGIAKQGRPQNDE